MNLEKLIEAAAKKAAKETVAELKRTGMMKDARAQNRYRRAEDILRRYGDKSVTPDQARNVEEALATISGEQYAETVQMFYFEGLTNAEIAEQLHASEKTVVRKRQRLMQKLSAKLGTY